MAKKSTNKQEILIFGIKSSKLKPILISALLGSVTIAGIVGIISLLIGEFGEIQGRVLFTSIVTSGLSVGLLIYSTLLTTIYRIIGWLGTLSAVTAFLLGLGVIWIDWSSLNSGDLGLQVLKGYAFATVLAIAFAHMSLVVRLLEHKIEAIRIGIAITMGCMGLLAFLIGVLIYSDFDNSEQLARWMGVLSILIATGTVTLPVWARLQKK